MTMGMTPGIPEPLAERIRAAMAESHDVTTMDDRVMLLALPWVQAWPKPIARLIQQAVLDAYGHDAKYTAGERESLHLVIQTLGAIEQTRPYHEDNMRNHPGKRWVTRGEWIDA